MSPTTQALYVGIRGVVVAIDRATGHELWRTSVKGADFVNVAVQDGDLFAAARGELYRLDPSSGEILWHNPLKGLGWGLVSIAGSGQLPPIEEKRRRERAAAAAATS